MVEAGTLTFLVVLKIMALYEKPALKLLVAQLVRFGHTGKAIIITPRARFDSMTSRSLPEEINQHQHCAVPAGALTLCRRDSMSHMPRNDGNSRAWKKFLDNKIWNGRHPTGEEQASGSIIALRQYTYLRPQLRGLAR